MATRMTDPAVAQIFADILALMGSEYTSVSTTANVTGTGTNLTINCTGADGSTWNYGEFAPGIRVSISPTMTSLGPGQIQQFVGAAVNPDGSSVTAPTFTWTFASGAQGTIDATGLYTAPAVITIATTEQIKCTLVGSTAYATLLINLHP